MTTPKVIIVIPCYNAASAIGAVVHGARASGLPVVVVDDGSEDGSSDAAREAGADLVMRHPRNQGKGAAIRTGFRYAMSNGAAAVLTLDADGQHDPREIPALVAAHVESPDALIMGVRSFSPEAMPRRSRIGNRVSTFWIARFAGRRFSDTQSGFRIYPRTLASLPTLRQTRFDTETELLLWAAKLDLPLVEVPVSTIYGPDRVTHFHGFTDTLHVMGLVVLSPLWFWHVRRQRQQLRSPQQ